MPGPLQPKVPKRFGKADGVARAAQKMPIISLGDVCLNCGFLTFPVHGFFDGKPKCPLPIFVLLWFGFPTSFWVHSFSLG